MMWLKCSRASANEFSGILAVHYVGILETHGGTNYHVAVGPNRFCVVCDKLLIEDDECAMIGDDLLHYACCVCECPTHRRQIASPPIKVQNNNSTASTQHQPRLL